MDDKLFDQLMRSAEQMGKITKDEERPSRSFHVFDELTVLPLMVHHPVPFTDLDHIYRIMGQHAPVLTSHPKVLIDSESTVTNLDYFFKNWEKAQHDLIKQYTHNILFERTATHLRGKYIHQHKGKRKRQHPIKSEYVKDRHMFTNCYPVGIGDQFDDATFKFTWGE